MHLIVLIILFIVLILFFLSSKKQDNFINNQDNESKVISSILTNDNSYNEYVMLLDQNSNLNDLKNSLKKCFWSFLLNNYIIFFDKPEFNGKMFFLPIPKNQVIIDRKSYPSFFEEFLMFQHRSFSYICPPDYHIELNSPEPAIITNSTISSVQLSSGMIKEFTIENTLTINEIKIISKNKSSILS